jgi:hypothetical protein
LLAVWVLGWVELLKADPPARVGRINYLSGRVSFERGDLDEWVAARINYPMMTGDHLWVDDHARAELHVGSTALRLAPQTGFSFLNLNDQTVQIRLPEGTLNVHVRTLGPDEVFEIDTPNAAVSLLRPGDYRIDVGRDGRTSVTAWHGQAEVTAAGSAFSVRARQRALISGTDAPTYDLIDAPRPDDFDTWAVTRERREEQSASVRYVSREMVGYEELDAHGRWRTLAGYGPVWAPITVPVGWAPYRYGHWVWIEPWGWTWIDDAPWGFAPFHYGRWAYVQGSWYWMPGTLVARPVYAPALVAFIGGPRWGLSLSFGGGSGIGWFPLGPSEVYVPAYSASPTYVRNINVTHVTNVTNITNVNVTNVNYVNRTVAGAVTAVPQATFTSARPVAPAAVTIPAQAVASAPVMGMTATVAPHRESLVARPATDAVAVTRPPAAVINRPVVAKVAPPASPIPFAACEQALKANPGKPLDEPTQNRVRQSLPTAQVAHPTVQPAAPATTPQGGKAPALHRARPELPAAQAVTFKGFVPAPKPAGTTTSSAPASSVAPAKPKVSSDRPPYARPASPQQTKPNVAPLVQPNGAVPAASQQAEPKPEQKENRTQTKSTSEQKNEPTHPRAEPSHNAPSSQHQEAKPQERRNEKETAKPKKHE